MDKIIPHIYNFLLFTFYPVVSEIVYMRNYFIHELELENDRGAVETSFVFFIACFITKCFTKNLLLLNLNVWLFLTHSFHK